MDLQTSDPQDPAEADPYMPAPDQLALAFASALLSSGLYAAQADQAIATAWAIVPAYYIERERYARETAPKYFNPA